jgi:hypothetical protein
MRKTPVTLGVLAIIFGAVVALYDGGRLVLTSMSGALNKTLGAAMSSAPRRPGQPDMSVMMERSQTMAKQLMPYTASLMAGMVVFSLVLIFIGVGLYKRKAWARSAAIGWSALGLLYLAVDTVVHMTIILPRTQAMMQEMFASMPNADKVAPMMGAVGGAQTGVILAQELFLAAWPVVLLILLGRRSATSDFVD